MFGDIDVVFTNDAYGKKLAKLLNADWMPIDTKREMIPISATKIREDTAANWDYINKYAKRHFQKRVAVVGPESTGKSTLVKYLANAYKGSSYVTEYGRVLSEVRDNTLTEKDFEAIVLGQNTNQLSLVSR